MTDHRSSPPINSAGARYHLGAPRLLEEQADPPREGRDSVDHDQARLVAEPTALRELLGEGESPLILVVGAGEMGKGMRPIAEDPDLTVISTDVYMSPSVNIIADAHSLPFPDVTSDGVICQVVLEHVLDPVQCVAEIRRVLEPRSLVYAETPFMQHVHGGPSTFEIRCWRPWEIVPLV